MIGIQASVIPDMPAAEYHADPCPTPSLSSGLAKVILAKSARAAMLAHPKLSPKAARKDESKFDIGTSAHAMLLEGDASRIVVVEADDWKTKAAREARDEAHASGKTALLAHTFAGVAAMVEAAKVFVAQSEIAADWKAAKSEQTILWCEDGTWLRARADRLSNDRKVIIDYKTTGDASPPVFTRQMATLGYHVQDAFYRRAVRALGLPDPKFIFFAQETEAPYECALYGCDPLLREIGEAQVEAAIGRWSAALRTNKWEGYGSRVHWANAPGWLQQEHQEILASGEVG